MKLHQEFEVAQPVEVVWDYFHQVPRVAESLPGAEYLGEKDGKHLGKITSKVGPFQASFEGEATVTYTDADKSIQMEGKGVDRKGASRGKMTMNCMLEPAGTGTKVVVDSDVQLSGSIAQFGRVGLINEIANVLVADFVRNAEADMARAAGGGTTDQQTNDGEATDGAPSAKPAPARPASKPISGTSLLWMSLKGWVRSWFGK